MDIRRGAIVAAAPSGRFSKPRPVLIIQNQIPKDLETVLVIFITSDLERVPGLRVSIAPSAQNGLRQRSEVMVDLIQAIPKEKLGRVIGYVDNSILTQVEVALRLLLDLP